MEMRFERSGIPYLDTVVREVRSQELTQEIRLPEGMPDIGRVLCAWGQPVLRGKEWGGGRASVSGGLMVWVLYAPEDGETEQCMEGWMPFQINWELPEDSPDGTLRTRCLPRFVDARSVSPRKLMLRAGVGIQAEALIPDTLHPAQPEPVPEGIEVKQNTWPVQLVQEAGEKAFVLDEDLSLPASAPVPEALLCCRLNPKISEKRVVGSKLVFRGNGNLRILYRSREGQLHSWNFDLPFSQFAELERDYGSDAQADVLLCTTALEPELTEEGRIRFRGGVTAQYRISDRQLLTLAEDAYCPGRELEVMRENLEVPTVLETRRENLYAEQTIPLDADLAVDVSFLPDFPHLRRTEDGLVLTMPGQFQLLCYGPDSRLHGNAVRWEGSCTLPIGEDVELTVIPASGEQPDASVREGQVMLTCPVPLELTATVRQQLPMVTELKPGAAVPKDPGRPSLILRRAGEQGLWEIAKEAGTTVAAIARANGLREEPAPQRLLLIPVP